MARWQMERHKTLLLKNPHADKNFSDEDISRIIEMGWEDRTAFEAIEAQFGINQDGVIKIMRANLKLNSFKLWRERTNGRTTKHASIRSTAVTRHKANHRVKQF